MFIVCKLIVVLSSDQFESLTAEIPVLKCRDFSLLPLQITGALDLIMFCIVSFAAEKYRRPLLDFWFGGCNVFLFL